MMKKKKKKKQEEEKERGGRQDSIIMKREVFVSMEKEWSARISGNTRVCMYVRANRCTIVSRQGKHIKLLFHIVECVRSSSGTAAVAVTNVAVRIRIGHSLRTVVALILFLLFLLLACNRRLFVSFNEGVISQKLGDRALDVLPCMFQALHLSLEPLILHP